MSILGSVGSKLIVLHNPRLHYNCAKLSDLVLVGRNSGSNYKLFLKNYCRQIVFECHHNFEAFWRNLYAPLKYFVFIVSPGIGEFNHQDIYLEIRWQSKDCPDNWLWAQGRPVNNTGTPSGLGLPINRPVVVRAVLQTPFLLNHLFSNWLSHPFPPFLQNTFIPKL